jgi:hypothetical protein
LHGLTYLQQISDAN